VEILKSYELARKVVQKLNLTVHPALDPRQSESREWISWLPKSFVKEKAQPSDANVLHAVVGAVMRNLQVQAVRGSYLAQISFISYDRELAAKVPNTVAELFIESDLEARLAMTQKASAWMGDRMGDLRTKLEASERSLQEYRERERIIDAKGIALSGASRGFEESMSSLASARNKRAEAETLYNQVQAIKPGPSGQGFDSIPAVLRHPLVQKFREQEADAERRLSDASKRYGAEHPKMIQANADLASARENARRQIDSVVAGIRKEYEIARANEQVVAGALEQSKAVIQGINRKEFQLGVLERDAQANRQLYDMFLTRSKETSAAGDLQSTVARVIDPAMIPGGAFSPNVRNVVTTSVVLALVTCILLALLLDRLNNTLNSTHQVEERLRLPMLGSLQKIKGFEKKGFKSELEFFNNSQSTFAEAIRTIRTSILMSGLDSPHKIILVTSSVPEEGKTTVAFNLACALAQVKKVLLIDGDLRRPKIARLVGRESRSPGLSNMVVGTSTISQCIFLDSGTGLHVMGSGEIPPNPLELLSSRRFMDVVDKLKSAFDVIVIDSAPMQLVSDAMVLSQIASSIVYVVKADSTPYQVAQSGIKRLMALNAPIAGVVLNQLDVDRAERYYGEYGGGYGSYKGYTYGKSAKA
jgi:capsular exopolysaccharide synthesis family protein